MKAVQTSVTEVEYRLLEEYARKRAKTIKETVREAIRRLVMEDQVSPEDPIFTMPPSSPKTGKSESTSEAHDRSLYGGIE